MIYTNLTLFNCLEYGNSIYSRHISKKKSDVTCNVSIPYSLNYTYTTSYNKTNKTKCVTLRLATFAPCGPNRIPTLSLRQMPFIPSCQAASITPPQPLIAPHSLGPRSARASSAKYIIGLIYKKKH